MQERWSLLLLQLRHHEVTPCGSVLSTCLDLRPRAQLHQWRQYTASALAYSYPGLDSGALLSNRSMDRVLSQSPRPAWPRVRQV